jgi:hypothetical protein
MQASTATSWSICAATSQERRAYTPFVDVRRLGTAAARRGALFDRPIVHGTLSSMWHVLTNNTLFRLFVCVREHTQTRTPLASQNAQVHKQESCAVELEVRDTAAEGMADCECRLCGRRGELVIVSQSVRNDDSSFQWAGQAQSGRLLGVHWATALLELETRLRA